MHSHLYPCPSVPNLLFSRGTAALGPSVVSILTSPMEDEPHSFSDGILHRLSLIFSDGAIGLAAITRSASIARARLCHCLRRESESGKSETDSNSA